MLGDEIFRFFMLRGTGRLGGSYILNQRLIPDWWQSFYREEVHRRAKERLEALYRLARGSAQDEPATTAAVYRETRNDDVTALTPAASESQSTWHEEQRVNTAPSAPPLFGATLYEMNGLVGTFSCQNNVKDLSAALQFMREHLHLELSPFHYHALFRVFSNNGDKENAVQLMEVMAQRGETTLETYARAIDCIHCLAPVDALERALAIVKLAHKAFGTLLFEEIVGSEGATVAAYGSGPEHEAAMHDLQALPGPEEGARGILACPVLTALLHHLSISGRVADPVAPLLVAVWIRALGVQLSDWDYACICTSLLVRVEDFPRVRSTLGVFHGYSLGKVSPQAVLDRLQERGKDVLSPAVIQIVEAMQVSLALANVDMNKAIRIGVINTQASGLQLWIERILDDVEVPEGGLGPRRYNVGVLYHTLSLLHSTLRDNMEAVRLLIRAAEAEERSQARLGKLSQTRVEVNSKGEEDILKRSSILTVSTGERGAMVERPLGKGEAQEKEKEPMIISPHYVENVGAMLPWLSRRARNSIHNIFSRLTQRVVLQHQEAKLHIATTDALLPNIVADTDQTSRSASSTASVWSLMAPAVVPLDLDASACEGYALAVIQTVEEARQVLRRVVARMEPNRVRMPRTIQLAFRQLAHFCCRHPLRNCKLTPIGFSERQRWGAYLDARDISLALFGSARQARDYMKQIYYNKNNLPALRSEAMVKRDVADVTALFFQSPSHTSVPVPWLSGSGTAPDVKHWLTHRTTTPHIRCPSQAVPPHLYDPAVYNPYPHVALLISPVDIQRQKERAPPDEEEDLFAELWRTIMSPTFSGKDIWYLHNTDMYMLLMRCLLHRLDWEAAAHLTMKMQEHSVYTYLMDHELTTIFKEIGDPAGCLAFKVATKLFDGRITRDGQTKREKFHMEKFS